MFIFLQKKNNNNKFLSSLLTAVMVKPQQQNNKVTSSIPLRNWKQFTELKGGQRRQVIADLRKFINHYSAGDQQALLNEFFSDKKGTV